MPVVLHLGFHKTGTSSAQALLARHRAKLAPFVTIGLLSDVKPAEKAARRFSKQRDAGSLIETGIAFDRCLARLWPDPGKPLLISCEGLAGDIPGRREIADYIALVELAPVYLECLRDRRPGLEGVRLILSARRARGVDYLCVAGKSVGHQAGAGFRRLCPGLCGVVRPARDCR